MRIASIIARYLLGLIFSGPAVWGRDLRLALLGGCLRPSGARRRAAFGEPVCAAGACVAWTGDREHLFLSRANGSRGASTGNCCRRALVDSRRALQTISRRNLRSARGVKTEQMARRRTEARAIRSRCWACRTRLTRCSSESANLRDIKNFQSASVGVRICDMGILKTSIPDNASHTK